jgi:hypothetical protein
MPVKFTDAHQPSCAISIVGAHRTHTSPPRWTPAGSCWRGISVRSVSGHLERNVAPIAMSGLPTRRRIPGRQPNRCWCARVAGRCRRAGQSRHNPLGARHRPLQHWPNDFAQSLGYPGQPDHPEVVKTMQEITRRIRHAGRTVQSDVMQGAWVSDMLLDAGRRILEGNRAVRGGG